MTQDDADKVSEVLSEMGSVFYRTESFLRMRLAFPNLEFKDEHESQNVIGRRRERARVGW